MNTYHLDLATGEITQATPIPAGSAATDDEYLIDPKALQQPDVRRALGDIYQAIRNRRFVTAGPANPPSGELPVRTRTA